MVHNEKYKNEGSCLNQCCEDVPRYTKDGIVPDRVYVLSMLVLSLIPVLNGCGS